jgi:uncharacterized protein YukE
MNPLLLRSIAEHLQDLQAQRPDLPSSVQIDTDQLDSIAARFGAYAAEIDQILAELAPHVVSLRTESNERLNAELDELLIPNIRYLKHHFNAWQTQVAAISSRIQKLSHIIEDSTRHIQTPEDVQNLVRNNTLRDAAAKADSQSEASKSGASNE